MMCRLLYLTFTDKFVMCGSFCLLDRQACDVYIILVAVDTPACDAQIILETLATACTRYGRKNLRILYDALSTLAELVGNALAEPSLLRIFMPPLLAKWQSLGDTDRDLLPLLECFTALITALGAAPLLSLIKQAPHLCGHIGSEVFDLGTTWAQPVKERRGICPFCRTFLFPKCVVSDAQALCLCHVAYSRQTCFSCVFLPAGLAAGSWLSSCLIHASQQCCKQCAMASVECSFQSQRCKIYRIATAFRHSISHHFRFDSRSCGQPLDVE